MGGIGDRVSVCAASTQKMAFIRLSQGFFFFRQEKSPPLPKSFICKDMLCCTRVKNKALKAAKGKILCTAMHSSNIEWRRAGAADGHFSVHGGPHAPLKTSHIVGTSQLGQKAVGGPRSSGSIRKGRARSYLVKKRKSGPTQGSGGACPALPYTKKPLLVPKTVAPKRRTARAPSGAAMAQKVVRSPAEENGSAALHSPLSSVGFIQIPWGWSRRAWA